MKFSPFRRSDKRAHHSKPRNTRSLGSRLSRFESLEDRCLLAAPTLADIGPVTVLAGAPLHIALNGSDADGDTLTFTASSTNSTVLTPIAANNRSLRISVAGRDPMEFQLFENLAPKTTARIIELANSNFYDNNIFHRVIKDFMIQGGDPKKDGTGGSGVVFDDEFDPSLQFTSSGILAMANSGDDTNDSQFFITSAPARHLDFNHTIFGFLTKGDAVRESIESVPVNATTYKPTTDVVISSIDVFTDTQNGVLTIDAPPSAIGTTVTVTVTVDDGNGGTATKSFQVTVAADTTTWSDGTTTENDSNPFLWSPPANLTTVMNQPITFNIPGYDVENDRLYYDSVVNKTNSKDLSITATTAARTGVTVITPQQDFIGVRGLKIAVRQDGLGVWDTQNVPVIVRPTAPTGIELLPASDTGLSNSDLTTKLDNSAAGKKLSFRVSGVTPGTAGLEVQVYADGRLIGKAAATSSTVVVTTDGATKLTDGVHVITAKQVLPGQAWVGGNNTGTVDVSSDATAAWNLTVDAVAPQITTTPLMQALGGIPYAYDVNSNEEAAANVRYTLITAPDGMTVNPATGQIVWIPQLGQGPSQRVTVRATDTAGNQVDQTYNVFLVNSQALDFLNYPNADLTGGMGDLEFDAFRTGRLSVEALFSNAQGNIDLVLLNEAGQEVGRSATAADHERIDLTVTEGQTYKLVTSGHNPAVTFRITNLLADDGSQVTVYGTNINDEIALAADSQVTVNGVVYALNPSVVETIRVDALRGADKVTLLGDDGANTAGMNYHGAELAGTGYRINVSNAENVIIDGAGGNDTVNFYDSPGDDQFIAHPADAQMSGTGYTLQAKNFETVHAYASNAANTNGGNDTAELYDSALDDIFTASPTEATLSGPGFSIRAKSFEKVTALSTAGGIDTARLVGSDGDDVLTAKPTEVELSGTGFDLLAKSFEDVSADAGLGVDKATLYDSAGNDDFVGTPTYAAMFGTGFFNRARFFDEMVANSTAGGTDTAKIYDSTGDDTLEAFPTVVKLIASASTVTANQFEVTHAFATSGGTDTAKFFDSAGDDTFSATPVESVMSGAGYSNRAKMFEKVIAAADHGGNDTAWLYDSAGDDKFVTGTGTTRLTLDDASPQPDITPYDIEANSFDVVHAVARAGGQDTAEFHDTPGSDTFGARPTESAMFIKDDYYYRAKSFEVVEAYADAVDTADAGGDHAELGSGWNSYVLEPNKATVKAGTVEAFAQDFESVRAVADPQDGSVAKLYDSAGNDSFVSGVYGDGINYAILEGSGFSNRVESFAKVYAYSTAGGIDVAKMYDSLGSDTFYATPVQAYMSATGSTAYYHEVNNFAGVHAYSTHGGSDRATLHDSAGDDTYNVDYSNGAALFGAGFYNRAKGFVIVDAVADAGGADVAILNDSPSNDTLFGSGDFASLTYPTSASLPTGATFSAKSFDNITAKSTAGSDVKQMAADIVFALETEGTWTDV